MSDQVALVIPRPEFNDGDTFVVLAYFRSRLEGAAEAPTTIEWRIDDLTNRQVVQDWTTFSPAAESAEIEIAHALNTIINSNHMSETKQITVMADRGLTFQCSAKKTWKVRNLSLQP